jgi:predicted O-methyltransferase YrrM
MASRTEFISEKITNYIVAHSLRDMPLLAELRAETEKLPEGGMQIPAEQGQFLALLVNAVGASRCIEIGTFTGYSALCVALALPDDGKLLCCDVSDQWTRVGKPYWERAGVAGKIELVIAPAMETLDARLAKGEAGTWDFAFIDADKPNYINYYERCLKLLRKGGLIVFDNTLWSGAVADDADQSESTVALRKLNDKLHHDERVAVSLLTIGDGVTLALRR